MCNSHFEHNLHPLNSVLTQSLFAFCRELKIRLRRDTELFTDDFTVENADFDPAKVVTGDVEGTDNKIICCK